MLDLGHEHLLSGGYWQVCPPPVPEDRQVKPLWHVPFGLQHGWFSPPHATQVLSALWQRWPEAQQNSPVEGVPQASPSVGQQMLVAGLAPFK